MLKSFLRDTGGNVAMMFSVSVVSILAAIGVAIDYGSASAQKQSLQDIIDAATLAAAKSNTTDQSELDNIVAKVVAENNQDSLGITLDVKVIDDQIHVTGRTKYDTVLIGFIGKERLNVTATAASPIAALTPVKIALVLDTTESMDGADISALKQASEGLLDELEKFEAPVAVSVVPFGQYVNVGTHRKGVNWLDVSKDGTSETKEHCWQETEEISPRVCTNTGRKIEFDIIKDGRNLGRGERDEQICTGGERRQTGNEICEMRTTNYVWNGCVGSRQSPYNEQAAFGSTRINGVMNRSCGTELTELTMTFSTARSAIQNLSTSGNTYLPSGLMWGWRTLQDQEPLKLNIDMKRDNQRQSEPEKVMVFMTDGANTLSQGGSEDFFHEGSNANAANTRTAALCAAAKADGIQIYTVGYRISESTAAAKDVLIKCATSEAHYLDAANATELKKVFKEIAGKLDFSRLSI